MNLLRLIDDHLIYPSRHATIAKLLIPHLNKNQKILDVGSGDGKLALLLSQKTKTIFTGIDINPQPNKVIPIIAYDGQKIPFADNSFDTVIITDVLHHCSNPSLILKEAKRVTKKTILIKDHYWDNSLDFFILKITDAIGNIPYHTQLPFNFLSRSQWLQLFHQHQLKIIKQQKFSFNILDPVKHIFWVIEK